MTHPADCLCCKGTGTVRVGYCVVEYNKSITQVITGTKPCDECNNGKSKLRTIPETK